jgi:hypothetical protein
MGVKIQYIYVRCILIALGTHKKIIQSFFKYGYAGALSSGLSNAP